MSVTVGAVVFALALLQPSRAPAQQVVGYLGLTAPDLEAPGLALIRKGLKERGHEEGRTVVLEQRWAHGDNSRFSGLARDLLATRPAVVLSPCGQALAAIREVNRTLPVVALCADAKNFRGEVASLSRPGGFTTGFTFLAPESVGKRLELLKELRPGLSRVAILHYAGEDWESYWTEIDRVAPALGLTFRRVPVERADDLERAFATMVRERAEALIVLPDATTLSARERIAKLALQHRLPTGFDVGAFAIAGGLLSYGPYIGDLYERAAGYVDKILKGAAPADLPVQQPIRFQLVLNLKTARALGLRVPKSVLSRADEVIQ